ncbi:GNAT family N-acetyltransferase [Pseudarthrobacter sp. NamB4]|uniref:GNAT family N-acetyltransferase n=1 Tax=Pseudarthrobacter sp. NamB4 TaxID=2576837 RepID=UPI0010FD8049|nr:GNAT family N-acetyltransferase [Pseudarthrobacter sp. NamB4]TLM73074.1 GNAT family N-acetyltransferase [Pseudarthrobacter sp. NamB4]
MVSLISLAVLLEPQDLKPAVLSPRRIKAADVPRLADLYLHAYADGTYNPNTEKAADRIRAIFEGARGAPIPEASFLTADADGNIIAAIVTTNRVLGDHGSETAFVAELFTHPDHRRKGLAERLLKHAMHALHRAGHRTLAVTVNIDNAAALALYLSRDFRRLTQPAENN